MTSALGPGTDAIRMVAEAERRGANAIVAMRFDSGAIGQWSEICAYGTAVWASPLSEQAKAQHEATVRSGRMPHQQPYEPYVSEGDSTPPGPVKAPDAAARGRPAGTRPIPVGAFDLGP